MVPLHTPHLSLAAVPPHTAAQSVLQYLLELDWQSPHLSSLLLPLALPAQSTQLLVPAHTPHLSLVAAPPHTALQSAAQSFALLLSHTPQLSVRLAPCATPLQSRHEFVPLHTLHLSFLALPPAVPKQSYVVAAADTEPPVALATALFIADTLADLLETRAEKSNTMSSRRRSWRRREAGAHVLPGLRSRSVTFTPMADATFLSVWLQSALRYT